MSLFLKDCDWVVTQDQERRVLQNVSVRVLDGRITEVGRLSSARKEQVVDCRGKLLIPGLINTHTHLPMTLLRGYADDLELRDWLQNKIWPLEKRLTAEMCYNGAMLGCAEMIRTGTTCMVDMYFHMRKVADAVHEAGLRAFLSHGIIDPADKSAIEKDRSETLGLMKHIKALNDQRVRFIVGPHAPYTVEEETLLWSSELAEEEDTFVNIHIAETRMEQARFEREKHIRVAQYLDEIGFLSERVLAAHSVWLTKSEVKLFGERGVRVAHCPVSNMKLAGGGVAPVPEFWGSGVPVGLGTDGPASNNSLDMFETMKVCALIHKAYRWDPTVVPAQRVLDMATVDGARCVGMEKELGGIEPGRRADMLLLDLEEPNMVPILNASTVVSDLVYSANGMNVDTTIVDGHVLMAGRKLLTLNMRNVLDGVRASVRELVH